MKFYIGIAIRKSGHAAVTKPYSDEEEMLTELKAYTKKHFNNVLATTFITRESDEPITLQDVFGKPKSRDLMQDKKFIKEITNG